VEERTGILILDFPVKLLASPGFNGRSTSTKKHADDTKEHLTSRFFGSFPLKPCPGPSWILGCPFWDFGNFGKNPILGHFWGFPGGAKKGPFWGSEIPEGRPLFLVRLFCSESQKSAPPIIGKALIRGILGGSGGVPNFGVLGISGFFGKLGISGAKLRKAAMCNQQRRRYAFLVVSSALFYCPWNKMGGRHDLKRITTTLLITHSTWSNAF